MPKYICKYCEKETPNENCICKNCYDKLPLVKKLCKMLEPYKKYCRKDAEG